jgi:bisphosphoglycerate-independent phosphoglycerate mutase (AlkP superfamily)
MTSSASAPDEPGRPIASPSRTTVDLGDGTKWVGPASAEDALNTAKEYRLTAQQHAEVRNVSDYDMDRADRAERAAQMYAMLSIAESLVELTRAVREINERGRGGASNV